MMNKIDAIRKLEMIMHCCQVTNDTDPIPALQMAIDAIKGHYTEQNVRDAFNDGYACGKDEVIRCVECKRKYMKSMGYYCDERTHPLNPRGHCERGEK